MKALISVIVPVYKAEKYLHSCVDSILNQTYRNFELILVDDGSPDDCGEICNHYAEKDSRVQVFHKKNGGVASSRNQGIKMAKGKYILFIDSDDWIEESTLETLINNLQLNSCDVLIFGLIKDLYRDSKCIKSEINALHKKMIIDSKEMKDYFSYLFNSIGMQSSCNFLFNAEIIKNNKLYFNDELVLYEDFHFNLRYLKMCQTILIIPNVLYHYNLRTEIDQLSKRNKINIVSNISIVSKGIIDYLKFIEAGEDVYRNMYSYILVMYNLCFKKIISVKGFTKITEKFDVLKDVGEDEIFNQLIDRFGSTLKFYKVLYFLIKSKLYFIAYPLLKYKL